MFDLNYDSNELFFLAHETERFPSRPSGGGQRYWFSPEAYPVALSH